MSAFCLPKGVLSLLLAFPKQKLDIKNRSLLHWTQGGKVRHLSNFIRGGSINKWKENKFECQWRWKSKGFGMWWGNRFIIQAVSVWLWYFGQFCFSLIYSDSVVVLMYPSCPVLTVTFTTQKLTNCRCKVSIGWGIILVCISVCWGCIPICRLRPLDALLSSGLCGKGGALPPVTGLTVQRIICC